MHAGAPSPGAHSVLAALIAQRRSAFHCVYVHESRKPDSDAAKWQADPRQQQHQAHQQQPQQGKAKRKMDDIDRILALVAQRNARAATTTASAAAAAGGAGAGGSTRASALSSPPPPPLPHLELKFVSTHDLNAMSENRPHNGVVLDTEPLEPEEVATLVPSGKGDGRPEVWVVLDQVTDPQNMGAIARSAYFFGARGRCRLHVVARMCMQREFCARP